MRNATTPSRYADGGGLYLLADPAGAMRWVSRTVVRGKRRDIGLGGVRTVPLADARAAAEEFRRIARKIGDSHAERDRATETITTFEVVVETDIGRPVAPQGSGGNT